MANEKTLLVVVGVDEPAGDALRAVAADLARVRMKDVDAVDFHADLAVKGVKHVDIGLAEDDEEVSLAGVLQVFGHVKVGVHARLEDRDAAELRELGGMRLEVERTSDEDVEAGIGRLPGGVDEIGAKDGAEFRSNEDPGTPFDSRCINPLDVSPVRADVLAGPGRELGEGNPVFLVRLLDAGSPKVLDDHLRKVGLRLIAHPPVGDAVDDVVVFIDTEDAVR